MNKSIETISKFISNSDDSLSNNISKDKLNELIDNHIKATVIKPDEIKSINRVAAEKISKLEEQIESVRRELSENEKTIMKEIDESLLKLEDIKDEIRKSFKGIKIAKKGFRRYAVYKNNDTIIVSEIENDIDLD